MKRSVKKNLKLSQIYQYSDEKQSFLVPISLETYDELFNAWDAAPIKRRDIEPDLLHYLEQVSFEIPMTEKIILLFQLPEEVRDLRKEQIAREAIYHNFTMIRHFINQETKRNNRKMVAYFIIGIIFLSASYLFQNLLNPIFPFSILVDGFFIGGWVMFWEAFSLFFFSGNELRSRKQRYLRYSDSAIEFTYQGIQAS